MSTNSATDITDPRAMRMGNIVKWIFLILAFAFFAPVIWLAVGGFVGFLVFVSIYVAAWMLREPVFTWAANQRLKMIQNAVAEDPVPTLQEEHRKRQQDLEDRMKGIEGLSGSIRSIQQAITEIETEFPDSPELDDLRADHRELQQHEAACRADWESAYITNEDFAREIKRVGKLWNAAMAIKRARGKTGVSQEEWMSQMKTDTAIFTIRNTLNTQMAGLTTQRMQIEARNKLRSQRALATVKVPAANPAPAATPSAATPPPVVAKK